MGKFHLNSGRIQDFEIEIVTQASDYVAAILTIYTDRENFKFCVSKDPRHPDLDRIVSNLKSGIQTAKETDADFQINEFNDRNYLFVTYPDGTIGEYTGSRVKI